MSGRLLGKKRRVKKSRKRNKEDCEPGELLDGLSDQCHLGYRFNRAAEWTKLGGEERGTLFNRQPS